MSGILFSKPPGGYLTAMVWNGNTSTSTGEFSPKAKGAEFNNSNNGYWNQKRGGVRGNSYFPYPRRGMHMRGGEFFAPRGFPPQQFRKMRPHWVPRAPRPPPPPPHFPPESYLPYPAPPWPAPQPPPPPPAAPAPVTQLEADTTLSETTHKRKKRVSNSTIRPWDKEAAEKAHALEMECQRSANAKSIVIRFPDPELSKEIVQGFHKQIDNVHFQGPCGVRYCFVTLKDEADVDQVMKDINEVKFGTGCLTAERKAQKPEENSGYENIDPFALYVGNLALNISVVEVKEKFPTATRIDVGHAKRMKNTRYAFVKFSTAEAALEAYKASVNTIMASRSIIVRFRRHKATFGPPGEESSSAATDTKPREKLTVGAKLKAKKEKAKAEKAAKEEAEMKKKVKLEKQEEESEEEVEMENDDDDISDYDLEDMDEIDDDDDDDVMNMVRESETEEEYELSADEEVDADDDDDDDDLIANIKDDDDNYFDDEDCKDVFSLTFDNL